MLFHTHFPQMNTFCEVKQKSHKKRVISNNDTIWRKNSHILIWQVCGPVIIKLKDLILVVWNRNGKNGRVSRSGIAVQWWMAVIHIYSALSCRIYITALLPCRCTWVIVSQHQVSVIFIGNICMGRKLFLWIKATVTVSITFEVRIVT